MNYFKDCVGEEQCTARYRELAKKHHPDRGGDTRVMQDINAEFERVKSSNWASPGTYKWGNDFTSASYDDFDILRGYVSKMRANMERAYDDMNRQAVKRKTEEENRRYRAKAKKAQELVERYSSWSHNSLVQLIVEMKLEADSY